ncbi:TPA: fimbrial protein [Proteus mirabilis]|nr:type 1 fimbrial protein [Proteus mirabilis]HEK0447478.1 type 1 fimbrial protein [Proteus mirabilis]HEK2945488.1 type 1 fimbrial protein [Proteus mirabilis]
MKGLKRYYTLLSLLLGYAGMCPYAFSAHTFQGHGEVSLLGKIVDTPCTIDIGSRDQAIDMGIIPISRLKQFGESEPVSFDVKLINCRWDKISTISKAQDQNEWKNFDITFIGPSKGEYFAVHGNAKGIKLSIYDDFNNKVIPGKVLDLKEITQGDINLKYKLYLVRDNKFIKSGVFSTIINFKINYY